MKLLFIILCLMGASQGKSLNSEGTQRFADRIYDLVERVVNYVQESQQQDQKRSATEGKLRIYDGFTDAEAVDACTDERGFQRAENAAYCYLKALLDSQYQFANHEDVGHHEQIGGIYHFR